MVLGARDTATQFHATSELIDVWILFEGGYPMWVGGE